MGSLLTLGEAARLTNTSPASLRQAILEGRLAGEKLGHFWVVERAEVERYIRDRQSWKSLAAVPASA